MTVPEANHAAEGVVFKDERLVSARFTRSNLNVRFSNGLEANCAGGIAEVLDTWEDVAELLSGLADQATEADRMLVNPEVQ